MPGLRRVLYAKINRRTPDQQLFDERSFSDDMRRLGEAGQFHAPVGDREWFATDLAIDASRTFMTGILGFMSVAEFMHIDTDSPSWKKAPTTVIEGGDRRSVTVFGIDLREDRRWLAFVATQRL